MCTSMQDPFRHPGPSNYVPSGMPNPMSGPHTGIQQPAMQPLAHHNHNTSDQSQAPKQSGAPPPTKIPIFGVGKRFDDGHKKTSFSAPSRTVNTLPPIVGSSQVGGGQSGSNSSSHFLHHRLDYCPQ